MLVLADGTTFEGEAIGALPEAGVAQGEVVFNTAMSGYQEILTDPSYAGQVITFTYPHIGNYGVNRDDVESRRAFCRGVIVRDLARRPSSWRATGDLDSFLVMQGIPGITGVDTRRLARHLRAARRAAGRVRHRRGGDAGRRRALRRHGRDRSRGGGDGRPAVRRR